MIVTTEAIVLKRLNFGDTSRIVSLFTRDFGRLSVIAKGVRTPRSKLGPILDTMNHVQVVIYRKEGRDLHLLSQCDLMTHYPRITADLHRLGCAISMLEYVSVSSREGDENRPLFATTLESLGALDTAQDPNQVLMHFQMQLLGILGFQPDFHQCAQCKRKIPDSGTKNEVFRLTADGILCGACTSVPVSSIKVDYDTLSVLKNLQGLRLAGSPDEDMVPGNGYQGARAALFHLLQTHVDGVSTMRSGSVLSALV